MSRYIGLWKCELFIEAVSNPEYSLALFHLYRVETEARATLVQPNAMRKANGRGNEKESWLRVGSALKKK